MWTPAVEAGKGLANLIYGLITGGKKNPAVENDSRYDPVDYSQVSSVLSSSAENVSNMVEEVVDSIESSDVSADSKTPTDYNFLEYLEGLFSSVGAENETNRVYNSAEAALNRTFQSAEAQIQRDWYTEMSNSAYQRAVKDMQAAGINPILAYAQGGAAASGTGVPSGSASSIQTAGGDTLSSILNSAANMISAIKGSSGRSSGSVNDVIRLLSLFT